MRGYLSGEPLLTALPAAHLAEVPAPGPRGAQPMSCSEPAAGGEGRANPGVWGRDLPSWKHPADATQPRGADLVLWFRPRGAGGQSLACQARG